MVTKYQPLLDMLKPQEEEPMMSQMTPEQLSSLQQITEPVVSEPAPVTTPQPAMRNMPAEQTQQIPIQTQEDIAPETNQTPMSKSEALLAEYNRMLGKDQESLAKARSQDRMLKVGGAIGDALATYLNARSQMNVKAPGVQVQQGAGLGKVADMFATSPEIASDVAARREALIKQYAELAKGERAQARLTSEEQRAKAADLRARELAQMQIEGNLKAAGIRASGKDEALELRKQQYAQLGEGQVEKLSVLKESIDESNALLPQLDKARKSLGIINTPVSDIEAKFGKNPEYQTLKQNYSSIRNSIRKAIFGATLTPGEQEEFDNELSRLSISDKNLEGSINNLIGRLKSKARSRLNTIAQTQPLKAETAMNAIKTFGLEETQRAEKNKELQDYADKFFKGDYDKASRFLKNREGV